MQRVRLIALAVAAALLPGAAMAADLEGSWSGSGSVVLKAGGKENVKCRVRYARQSAKVFSVSATCATPSTKILQTGEVLEVGAGRYVGDFYNPQFDVSGRVRVTVSGSSQSVSFSGAAGHGSLSLSR